MDLNSISYLFAGFSFFCLGLITSSKIIKHLRFSSFINLHHIRNIARPYRIFVRLVCFGLAIYLIGMAIWMMIDVNRDMFWILAGLGVLLILVRIFAFLFGDISILGFELEVDEAKAKQIGLFRSALILGGLILILLFGVVPFLADRILLMGFEKEQLAQHQRRIEAAAKDNFKEKYIPRNILTEKTGVTRNQPISEDSFFRNLTEQAGLRYIITGKAGVGKTWFLRQLSLQLQAAKPMQVIFFHKAEDLAQAETLEKYINVTVFGNKDWYTMPLTRQVLANALVLVDGFDEVEFIKWEKLSEKLKLLSENYPDATILVTTRPGALEPIPNYTNVILDEFSAKQYDLYIKVSRITHIKQHLDAALEKGSLDTHFIRLLGYDKALSSQHLSKDVVEVLFKRFLEKYKLDITAGDHYAFMSTFRDMEIMEELFIGLLLGGIENESILIRAGRKIICEQFLLQRIIRNYHLSETEVGMAREALTRLTDIAEYEYKKNPSMKRFIFDNDTLHINFNNTVLDRFALQSELLVEKSLQDKDHYVFEDITIDYYFISRVLFNMIENDPSQTQKILARDDFYKSTDILPFLIAQFDTAEKILGDYLVTVSRNIGNEVGISRHLKERFPDILLYLERSKENIAYVKNLPQNNVVLSLPASAQQVIRDAVNSYLVGV